ncbi:MAG: AzlD domain-containing protein [Tateyamaria sp.]|nr:AzlD domain-containing protein [Tateyamaria sp.]
MPNEYWILILTLSIASFIIRFLGLLAGDRIRSSQFSWILDELPGLIIVSLVAASLMGQPAETWCAASIALLAAMLTNHVIVTMGIGVIAFASFSLFSF